MENPPAEPRSAVRLGGGWRTSMPIGVKTVPADDVFARLEQRFGGK
jgi:hypothetical protein